MSGRITLANAIEDAGIERGKAERIASVIFDVIHENVATKSDVQSAEARLRTEIAGARSDLASIEHRLLTRPAGVAIAVGGTKRAPRREHEKPALAQAIVTPAPMKEGPLKRVIRRRERQSNDNGDEREQPRRSAIVGPKLRRHARSDRGGDPAAKRRGRRVVARAGALGCRRIG